MEMAHLASMVFDWSYSKFKSWREASGGNLNFGGFTWVPRLTAVSGCLEMMG